MTEWMFKARTIGCAGAVMALMALSTDYAVGQAPPAKPVAGEPRDAVSSVQVINVTSVPTIALSVNGKKDYPIFPQGEFTADGPIHRLNVKYVAENTATGAQALSTDLKLLPNSHQSVLIMGDFNTSTPPGELPQPGPPAPKPEKPFPPNVLFVVFPHDKKESDKIKLRVVNAMPGKELIFPTKLGKLVIEPGKSEVVPDQEAVQEYVAEVEGKKIDFLMKQEGAKVRNAMAIFYLKDGQPALQRAFEND